MKLFTLILLLITAGATAFGQTSDARISGNFQIDAQYYQKDSAIGAEEVDQKILSNSFLYLNYSMGNFNAGLRYEAYLDPLLGFDQGYKGSGIAYRFVEFNTDVFSATAGHFYEQFGSGLIFRAYEERQLGVDNAVDGIRVKFRPADGISFTGIYGRQRLYWGLGEGIIRGGDLDLNVNDLFTELLPSDIQLNIGGSVISKFQPDNEPFYNLPENVLSYSTRAAVAGGNYTVEAEYAYKYNDPNATNFYNFNPGTGILLSASYFFPGFGISFDYHRIDNMDFRSDRNALENRLLLNFFPPQTKLHTYSLATIYPFSTQLNGETGIQGEITYTFSKGTALGGEYGTTLSLNYSRINGLAITPDTSVINPNNGKPFRYTSEFPGWGNRIYFQEFNLEVSKKWNADFKSIFNFIAETYDRDIMEFEGSPKFGKVNALIAIADLTYRISTKHSFRVELQHLWADQDSVIREPDNTNGNWAMILGEYTIAPSWYISLYDQYNYGNDSEDNRLHYVNGTVAYITGSTRISLGYGRQRKGIVCVGGVCRAVPASSGVFLSITSSF